MHALILLLSCDHSFSTVSSEATPRPVSVPGLLRPMCSQAIQGSMRGDPRYMVHYTDKLHVYYYSIVMLV